MTQLTWTTSDTMFSQQPPEATASARRELNTASARRELDAVSARRELDPVNAGRELDAASAPAPLRLLPRRPRDDALPEHVQYRDDGCDLFSSCLACPLPRCRYDTPGGARALLIRLRDSEIRRLRHDAGLPVEEIAMRFRVSRRTVFRVLQHDPQRRDRDGSAA